jgi:hypothetical protein
MENLPSKPLQTLTGPFTRGRPSYRTDGPATELTRAGYELIEQLASRGLAVSTIAKALGLSTEMFRRIRAFDDRAREALETGTAIEHDMLVGKLHEAAMRGEIVAIIFALKSRHGYRDSTPVIRESESRVKVEIQLPAALTPEQYARVIDVTPKRKELSSDE